MSWINRAAVAALISSILFKLLHSKYTSVSKECIRDWNGDPSPLFDITHETYDENESAIVHNHELTVRGRSFHVFQVEPSTKDPPSRNTRYPVLFLHGFPDNHHTFKHQMVRLASEGYTSFAPALRGYDPNDDATPPTEKDYSIPNLAIDAVELVKHLDIDGFHLVGHDWGSFIASTVAKLLPNQVASLTLMAVPAEPPGSNGVFLRHPDQIIRSWYILFFQMPLLPELWIRYGGAIEALWRHWGVCYSKERLQSVQDTIASPQRKGNTVAALGYYRINILPMLLTKAPLSFRNHLSSFIAWFHGLEAPVRIETHVQEMYGIKDLNDFRARPFGMPVLQLVGDSDGCISPGVFHSSSDIGKSRFRHGNKVVVVKDAGHFLQHEQRREVSDILVHFFHETDSVK